MFCAWRLVFLKIGGFSAKSVWSDFVHQFALFKGPSWAWAKWLVEEPLLGRGSVALAALDQAKWARAVVALTESIGSWRNRAAMASLAGSFLRRASRSSWLSLVSCRAVARGYSQRMKTITVTQARSNLGSLLTRAVNGEDIGIIESGSGAIVALRPVQVYSEDYALMEYGIETNQMKRIERRVLASVKRSRRERKLRRWP